MFPRFKALSVFLVCASTLAACSKEEKHEGRRHPIFVRGSNVEEDRQFGPLGKRFAWAYLGLGEPCDNLRIRTNTTIGLSAKKLSLDSSANGKFRLRSPFASSTTMPRNFGTGDISQFTVEATALKSIPAIDPTGTAIPWFAQTLTRTVNTDSSTHWRWSSPHLERRQLS